MTREDLHLIPGRRIPQASSVISTACEDILAIRRISHAGYVAAMTAEDVQGLATGDLPDAGGLVAAAS